MPTPDISRLLFTIRARIGLQMILGLIMLLAIVSLISVAIAATSPNWALEQNGAENTEQVDNLPNNAEKVSDCTTIKEPGQYYLTTDLDAGNLDSCIKIEASNVILNGNNHVVEGSYCAGQDSPDCSYPEDRTIGISVGYDPKYPVSNVTVRNFVTKGWGQGIGYNFASQGTIKNITDYNSRSYAIYLGDYATRNTVVNNTVWDSEDHGILLANKSSYNYIINNELYNNGLAGIGVSVSQGNEVRNNYLEGNDIGIRSEQNSPYVSIINNTVRDSEKIGIDIQGTSNTLIKHNDVRGDERGLFFRSSMNITAENNTLENKEFDIMFGDDVGETRVLKNNIISTDGPFLVSTTSTENTVSLSFDDAEFTLKLSNVNVFMSNSPGSPPSEEAVLSSFQIVSRSDDSFTELSFDENNGNSRGYYVIDGERNQIENSAEEIASDQMPASIIITEKIEPTPTPTETPEPTSTENQENGSAENTPETTHTDSAPGNTPGESDSEDAANENTPEDRSTATPSDEDGAGFGILGTITGILSFGYLLRLRLENRVCE